MGEGRGKVSDLEIVDRASLRACLEGRPREDSVVVAVRAALRVAPLAWSHPVIREDEGDLTSLQICRALLIGGVAGKMPTPPIRAAAAAATAAALAAAAAFAALATTTTTTATALAAATAAADAAFAAAIWEQVRADARAQESGEDPASAPLWSGPPPDWFETAAAGTRALWQADPVFSFWLLWLDGVLTGRQIDWALQEKVALIPDNVWRRGAEAVAAEIARIREQLRLRREVALLKAQLEASRAEIAALSNRLHNNPPQLVDDVADPFGQAALIVEALNEAEAELAREAPRPAVLNRVSGRLQSAARNLLAYCGTLTDIALKKGAGAVGMAGGAVLVAQMAGFWGKVENFANALWEFAKSLGWVGQERRDRARPPPGGRGSRTRLGRTRSVSDRGRARPFAMVVGRWNLPSRGKHSARAR